MRAGLFRAPMLHCRKRKAAFEKRQLSDCVSAIIYRSSTRQPSGKRSCTNDHDHDPHAHRRRKRAAYNRTVDEISRMPLDVALDLGIFREDAHKIALQAVYGR
jgi:uncharacterized protein YjiS (DUF1127 family)